MQANVVNWIRYEIRDLQKNPPTAYKALFAASATAPGDQTRRELVRVELDHDGKEMADSLELVAEYAVDLKFGLTVVSGFKTTANLDPNIAQFPIGDAKNYEYTYEPSSTSPVNDKAPHRVRSVRARLGRSIARSRSQRQRRRPVDGAARRALSLRRSAPTPVFRACVRSSPTSASPTWRVSHGDRTADTTPSGLSSVPAAPSERGAAVFVVVMVLTMLTAIGVFAIRAASMANLSSGYDRQNTQNHYVGEYGLLSAVAELSTTKRSAYVEKMGKGVEKCAGHQRRVESRRRRPLLSPLRERRRQGGLEQLQRAPALRSAERLGLGARSRQPRTGRARRRLRRGDDRPGPGGAAR